MPIEVGATETPTPTGVFELTGDSVSGWSASLNSGHAVLGYRLTGEDGAVVAEGVTGQPIKWTDRAIVGASCPELLAELYDVARRGE